MQRPDVRVIEFQSEEQKQPDLAQYEVDALLAKYGYKTQHTSSQPDHTQQPSDTRTFEDMCKEQERTLNNQINKVNRPRAITFDDARTNYSETKWSSIDEDGMNLGIQINIVSDFKI